MHEGQKIPLAKVQSPPQELEVGPRSGPYLLDLLIFFIYIFCTHNYECCVIWMTLQAQQGEHVRALDDADVNAVDSFCQSGDVILKRLGVAPHPTIPNFASASRDCFLVPGQFPVHWPLPLLLSSGGRGRKPLLTLWFLLA